LAEVVFQAVFRGILKLHEGSRVNFKLVGNGKAVLKIDVNQHKVDYE